MTSKQLQLLYLLSQRNERQCYVEWSLDGVDEKDLIELQDQDMIFVSLGDGFVGGLKTLSLTAKGQDFIKDYCDTCECMPCDCGYGS